MEWGILNAYISFGKNLNPIIPQMFKSTQVKLAKLINDHSIWNY
jgi:hypothetical protein